MPPRVIVITGASSGIGLATAEAIASQNATVVLPGRNPAKMADTVHRIRAMTGNGTIFPFHCDLSSRTSLSNFATEVCAKFVRVDVLINNAGVMNPRRRLTEDGIEETFAVNYLAPYLLTHCLLAALRASTRGRVINIGSAGHYRGHLDFADLQGERRYGCVRAYNQSKLALVILTYLLAEKLRAASISVNCIHPGIVHSNIWPREPLHLRIGSILCRLLAVQPQTAANDLVHFVTGPGFGELTGRYFHGLSERRSSRLSYDRQVQSRLWAVTAEMTGVSFTEQALV